MSKMHVIRRLTAYEVCGGLWRLTAAARGSNYRTTHTTTYTSWHTKQLHTPHCYVPGPLSHLL